MLRAFKVRFKVTPIKKLRRSDIFIEETLKTPPDLD